MQRTRRNRPAPITIGTHSSKRGRQLRGRAFSRTELQLAALVLVLVAALGAATSNAAFTAPVDLSPAGEQADRPQVGIDADGDAFAVWRNDTIARVQGRARSAAGVLRPVQTLSAGPGTFSAHTPDVAVDGEGDALAVWIRSTDSPFTRRVNGRVRLANGTLQPIQTFSVPGQDFVDDPKVAADADGDALVIWHHSTNSRIQARARSKEGTLGPVQLVTPYAVSDPQLAMDSDGDALVVWRRGGTRSDSCDPSACSRVQARARSKDGSLGPVQTLSPPGKNAFDARVATDAEGDATVVWTRWDGTMDCGSAFFPAPCRRVQARVRSADGTLGTVRTLSLPGTDASACSFDVEPGGPCSIDTGPQIGVDADGDAFAVWDLNSPSERIEGRALFKSGTLGSVKTLSSSGSVSQPRVGIDADGDAVAVWQLFESGTSRRIQARTRSRGGTLGSVETLSAAGQAAEQPQVAVAGNGAALAVWRRPDGTTDCGGQSCNRIQAAAGP